jgi:hypothetical protein
MPEGLRDGIQAKTPVAKAKNLPRSGAHDMVRNQAAGQ